MNPEIEQRRDEEARAIALVVIVVLSLAAMATGAFLLVSWIRAA